MESGLLVGDLVGEVRHCLNYFSCCYGKIPRQKQLKGESISLGSHPRIVCSVKEVLVIGASGIKLRLTLESGKRWMLTFD